MKEIVGVLAVALCISLTEYLLWKDGFSWLVLIGHTALVLWLFYLGGAKK